MKFIAYDINILQKFRLVKDAKNWYKNGIIGKDQFDQVKEKNEVPLFHPNVFIRVMLFLAASIALGGFTGLIGLMLQGMLSDAYQVISIFYGVALLILLQKVFIVNNHHYKSGITELLLYASIGLIGSGICGIFDWKLVELNLIVFFILCSLAGIYYQDLITTISAFFCFGFFLLYEMDKFGPHIQPFIPLVFFVVFLIIYFIVKKLRTDDKYLLWKDNLILAETISLLIIYLSVNYFVVRELSVEIMGLRLQEGQDIPLAWMFYALTVLIPLIYILLGIKNRDIVMLRTSLIVIAFTVFTFKYYFSLGHPEITLTLAGIIMISLGIWLNKLLHKVRKGFTREKLLTEKWHDLNAEALLMSQTMSSGTQENTFQGEGGEFGGGGASGSF